jgi:hypothetical protein
VDDDRGERPTLFDRIVEIIRHHGPDGPEDGESLGRNAGPDGFFAAGEVAVVPAFS